MNKCVLLSVQPRSPPSPYRIITQSQSIFNTQARRLVRKTKSDFVYCAYIYTESPVPLQKYSLMYILQWIECHTNILLRFLQYWILKWRSHYTFLHTVLQERGVVFLYIWFIIMSCMLNFCSTKEMTEYDVTLQLLVSKENLSAWSLMGPSTAKSTDQCSPIKERMNLFSESKTEHNLHSLTHKLMNLLSRFFFFFE